MTDAALSAVADAGPVSGATGGDAFGHRLIPPGDPLAGASFDAIWERKIKPELAGLEADRQKAVMIFGLALIAGAFLAYVEISFFPALTHGRAGRFDPRLPIYTLLGAGLAGFWPARRVARAAKADVIGALCAPMAVDYAIAGAAAPAFDEFLRLCLLPKSSGRKFQDFFAGRRGQVQFSLCQARLTQGSGRSQTTVFRGQLLRLTRERPFEGTTVVLRNTGILRGFTAPAGLARIGLEDPAFQKVFQAYGSDQVEARVILTPSFMRQLDDLEGQCGGQKLRCAFDGADLLIALEGGDRFEIGGMFTTLVDRARVEKIARDLEQVFQLIDAFEKV